MPQTTGRRLSPATFILLLIMLPLVPVVVKPLAYMFSLAASSMKESIQTTGNTYIDYPIIIGKYLVYYLFSVLSNETALYILLALGVIYAAIEST